MLRISMEDFLCGFYEELEREYNNEACQFHEGLFKKYVPKDIREALEERSLNSFCSFNCYPNGWMAGIQLFVYTYNCINIYFYSPSDLRGAINSLVNDENFKELVKVAFYIKQNIEPRN